MPQLKTVDMNTVMSCNGRGSTAEVDLSLDVYLQVTLEIVHADISPMEEQNATETAKMYKVNCDKRNITGMDSFTVQVLNASQVFMLPSDSVS